MSKTQNAAVIVAIVLFAAGAIWYMSSKPENPADDQNLAVTAPESQTQTQDQSMNTDTNTNPGADAPVTALKVVTTKEGTGPAAASGNTVSMNYTGRLLDGTTFDSNVDPKFGHVEPFEFPLGAGMVIAGWDQGILGMKVGEKRTLTIPANLAYGDRSPSPLIPANSAMIFEVELLAIK